MDQRCHSIVDLQGNEITHSDSSLEFATESLRHAKNPDTISLEIASNRPHYGSATSDQNRVTSHDLFHRQRAPPVAHPAPLSSSPQSRRPAGSDWLVRCVQPSGLAGATSM